MNDASTAKARQLLTMAGLLLVDLAAECVALQALTRACYYSNNHQQGEGEESQGTMGKGKAPAGRGLPG